MRKLITTTFLVFSLSFTSFSQNITGSWEGIMNDEVLRINIVQDGDNLCGFTSDVLINNPESYCMAYFKGKYSNKTWTLTGYKFIQNSGEHVLMKIQLKQSGSNTRQLTGTVTTAGSLFDMSLSDGFTVRKISDTPKKPFGSLSTCYEPNPKKKEDPKPSDPPKKPTTPPVTKKDPPKKENPVTAPPNNQDKKNPPSVELDESPVNTNIAKTEEMKKRESTVFKEIRVKTKKLTLKLYDNGEFDHDTVSVFYNNRLILDKALLTDRGTSIELTLQENTKTHEITLFAENLGTIAPNTALIIVQAGKDRYELNARSELNRNAVLRFVYDPD